MLDTDAVLDLVKEVAEKVVNPRFRDLAEEQVDEKGPGDLVTVADRESERLLTRFLRTPTRTRWCSARRPTPRVPS